METQLDEKIKKIKMGFFGTPQIAVWVLEELKKGGVLPSLIITNPDTPQGRKMLMTPSAVATWAQEHHISVLKPHTLRDESVETLLKESGCELFIVAAYGKIIPESILNIPKYNVINVHPSVLPKFRGASPIRSAILADENPTGVSIMILTKGVDEGPILTQEEITFSKEAWPMRGNELDELLARKGGELLLKTLPEWISGAVAPKEQDHADATFSTKITKEMGLLDLQDDPYQNLLKIRAFDGWPGTYFFTEKHGVTIRVKITDADLADDGSLRILRVIPEGKKEMDYEDFLRG